jgi:hypothetical protein
MKNLLSIRVAVIGVVAIVFGVLFMMQANSSRTTLVAELKASGITLATLDKTYDTAKAGLAAASAALATAPDAAKAAVNEKIQDAGWQKASLSAAKASRGTIDFVQMSGILSIILGAGFVVTGYLVMKKS